MLKHDLEYPEKKRLHCCNCRMRLDHFLSGKANGFDEDGNGVTLLLMACRVCEETTSIPAGYLGTGILTRLIVRRVRRR